MVFEMTNQTFFSQHAMVVFRSTLLIGLGMALADYLPTMWVLVAKSQRSSLLSLLALDLGTYLSWGVFACGFLWLTLRAPRLKQHRLKILLRMLVGGLLVAIVHVAFFSFIESLLYPAKRDFWDIYTSQLRAWAHFEVLAFGVLFFVVYRMVEPLGPVSQGDQAPSPKFDRPLNESIQRLTAVSRGRTVVLKTDQIQRIEGAGCYAEIHSSSGVHLLRRTMQSLERELGSIFLRVHRSTLVNIRFVSSLERSNKQAYEIVLTDGTRRRVSRSRQSIVKKTLRSMKLFGAE